MSEKKIKVDNSLDPLMDKINSEHNRVRKTRLTYFVDIPFSKPNIPFLLKVILDKKEELRFKFNTESESFGEYNRLSLIEGWLVKGLEYLRGQEQIDNEVDLS